MKRKNIFIALLAIAILLLAVLAAIIIYKKTMPVTPKTNYSSVVKEAPATPPLYQAFDKAPVTPVFMTDADKKDLGLSLKSNPQKIQVLKRNSQGKITEYKLIESDNDIVTSIRN